MESIVATSGRTKFLLTKCLMSLPFLGFVGLVLWGPSVGTVILVLLWFYCLGNYWHED